MSICSKCQIVFHCDSTACVVWAAALPISSPVALIFNLVKCKKNNQTNGNLTSCCFTRAAFVIKRRDDIWNCRGGGLKPRCFSPPVFSVADSWVTRICPCGFKKKKEKEEIELSPLLPSTLLSLPSSPACLSASLLNWVVIQLKSAASVLLAWGVGQRVEVEGGEMDHSLHAWIHYSRCCLLSLAGIRRAFGTRTPLAPALSLSQANNKAIWMCRAASRTASSSLSLSLFFPLLPPFPSSLAQV